MSAGKARKRRDTWIFCVFATQPGGMHRRLKCYVNFERALRSCQTLFRLRNDVDELADFGRRFSATKAVKLLWCQCIL